MSYALVNDCGAVSNLIEAEPEVACMLGAMPAYAGCAIGLRYAPPHEYTESELVQQMITDLELSDLEQGQTITDLELMILGGTQNV